MKKLRKGTGTICREDIYTFGPLCRVCIHFWLREELSIRQL